MNTCLSMILWPVADIVTKQRHCGDGVVLRKRLSATKPLASTGLNGDSGAKDPYTQ